MSNHPYLGDDFTKWQGQWEKALADGTFDDAPHPPGATPEHEPSDFFGQNRPNVGSKDIKDVDADYWNQVYQRAAHPNDAPDILTEAKKMPGKAEDPKLAKKAPSVKKGKESDKVNLDDKVKDNGGEDGDDNSLRKKKAKAVADDPNPQHPNNFGRDGVSKKTDRTRITAGWAADESIQKLHDLKLDLYDLECQMSDKAGLNEAKAKNIQTKIKSVKTKIDDLSNEFDGNWANSHEYQ